MSLTQALMRKSTRGGVAGRDQIAKRFNDMFSQDWGKLVSLLFEDSARFDSRQDRGAVAKMRRMTQNV